MSEDSVDKIVLGKMYSVANGLFDGYNELVKRETTISAEEGERLGGNIVARLCRLREQGIKTAGSFQLRN